MEIVGERISINIAILLPSFILILYVVPHILGVVYLVPFFIISFLPLIKRFLPKNIADLVYPLSAIFILLLFLFNLLVLSHAVNVNRFTAIFVIPLTVETMITLSIAMSIAAAIEGVFSTSLAKTIAALSFSLLPLMDQVFVLYLVNVFGYTYLHAYFEAYTMQEVSLIALVFTGSTNIFGARFPPPLAAYSFPIDPVMLVSMIISIIGVLSYFVIVKEKKLRSEVISGLSSAVFTGGIIGLIVFYAVRITSSSGLELLVAAIALVVTMAYASRSSPDRLNKKRNKRKIKDDW